MSSPKPPEDIEPKNPASASYWEAPEEGESIGEEERSISTWPAPPDVIQTQKGSLAWRGLGLIRTIRPHQWVKNVFVLAPVVFAKSVFRVELIENAASAFLVFCFLAGAVYTINDIADVDAARIHPVKRHRPIASGRVPLGVAKLFAAFLVTGSLIAAYLIQPFFALVAACYFLMNVAYSIKLKHVAYVDVGCIALGFVLRVMGGGLAVGVSVSWYLYACTALLALFLGFGKRRHELTTASAKAGKQRQALKGYTKRGLDGALVVTSLATVFTYLSYTLNAETQQFFKVETLWPTTLFVILGVLRFLHIVRNRPKAESPTQEMLSDGPMVGIVLFWVATVLWLVYHLQPS
ncbi:MAG: decaprenyl-phosphate phosphoribosyltransferase [Polyangiaceae bacterium]|nr:decaprenyl-phosphate phosphoribosyltransferase [Polyangiaceae bacterium]